MEQQSEPTLTIRWPHTAVLRAALLDGQTVQPLSEKDGQLVFPVRPEGRTHRLAIHWAVAGRTPAGRGGEDLGGDSAPDGPRRQKRCCWKSCIPSGFLDAGPRVVPGHWTPVVRRRVEGHRQRGGSKQAGDEAAGPAVQPALVRSRPGACLAGLRSRSNSRSIQFWTFRESLVTVPLAVGVFASVLAFFLGADGFPAGRLVGEIVNPGCSRSSARCGGCVFPRVSSGVGLVVASLLWFAGRQRARRSRGRHSLPSTVHLPA